ncbi:MAG: DUF429 domain-containing protein [Dehalococcoidia bacterium]|nr:DUF429 domain-containing protein [Dehalococcoidia bacterium]
MHLPSRRYQALGAGIVAGAVTARYIAKWRRRRSRRVGDQREGGQPSGRYFIGLDLTDPSAANRRPCEAAVIDPAMRCSFHQWDYDEEGASIVPEAALGKPFVMAVGGPQGLAADAGATARVSERLVNASPRSTYQLPADDRPCAGFMTGSARLFYKLATGGSRFRLLGLNDIPAHGANLIEVFPCAAWRELADESLPPKRSVEGRRRRADLLQAQGVILPSDLPTEDQLDAAVAAWLAHCFDNDAVKVEGDAPMIDREAGVIREGYIVQPRVLEPASFA